MRKRLMLVIAAVVVAVLVLAAFVSLRGNEVPVRVDTVVRQDLTNTIATNGKVQPIDNFEAHAPSAHTVKKVLIHEGDHVKAGQLLVQLDDSEARSEAAKALAGLRGSESDLHSI